MSLVTPVIPLRQQGFTLIEVIVTLVVFGILSVILMTAFGSSLSYSVQPVNALQKTIRLQQVVENIKTDFAVGKDLAQLKTSIGTGLRNNSYGSYQVLENKYVKFVGNVEQDGIADDGILKASLGDPDTGLVLTEFFMAW